MGIMKSLAKFKVPIIVGCIVVFLIASITNIINFGIMSKVPWPISVIPIIVAVVVGIIIILTEL